MDKYMFTNYTMTTKSAVEDGDPAIMVSVIGDEGMTTTDIDDLVKDAVSRKIQARCRDTKKNNPTLWRTWCNEKRASMKISDLMGRSRGAKHMTPKEHVGAAAATMTKDEIIASFMEQGIDLTTPTDSPEATTED